VARADSSRCSTTPASIGEQVEETDVGRWAAELEDPDTAAALARSIAGAVEDLAAQARELDTLLQRVRSRLDASGSEDESHARPGVGTDAAGARPATRSGMRSLSEASEGIALLVSQMAFTGSSEREIADRLRSDFGVANAEAVIESILGRSMPGGSAAAEPPPLPPAAPSTQAGVPDEASARADNGDDQRSSPFRAAEVEMSADFESARVLINQMATAGSTRGEILARLRSELDVQNPEAVLSAVLGGEATSGTEGT
jgi:hypothetical protein